MCACLIGVTIAQANPNWPVGRYSVTGEGAFAMQKQSFEEGVQHKRCRFLAKKELEKKKSFSG